MHEKVDRHIKRYIYTHRCKYRVKNVPFSAKSNENENKEDSCRINTVLNQHWWFNRAIIFYTIFPK